jgi:hypothetical protein
MFRFCSFASLVQARFDPYEVVRFEAASLVQACFDPYEVVRFEAYNASASLGV